MRTMKSLVAPFLLYLTICLVCVGLVAAPSCSGTSCSDPKNAGSAACNVINAVVDCTGVASLPSAVAVATPLVEGLIATARQADGSINWSSIETQLEDLALKYGMCVLAQIWNDYVNPPAPVATADAGVGSGSGSGSGSAVAPPGPICCGTSEKLKLSPTDAKAEFGRIRARVAPGKGFKVAGGTL